MMASMSSRAMHLAVVVDSGAVLVAVVGVDGVDGGLKVVLLDIAGGNNLAIVEAEKCLGVGRSHHAPADDADGDALVCRNAAGTGKRAGGEGGSGCGGLDEVTASDGQIGAPEDLAR